MNTINSLNAINTMNTVQQRDNNGIVIQSSFNHNKFSYGGCVGNSRPCSVEEHLRYLSQFNPMAHILYGIWIGDKLRLGKMLSLISAPPFQTFSDHGSGHSEMLLSTMARVLGNRMCLLGATDIWVMLECAYRHDLGMYIEFNDIKHILTDDKFLRMLKEYTHDDNEDIKKAAIYVQSQIVELRARYIDTDEIAKLRPDLTRSFILVCAKYFRSGHADRSKKTLINEMESINDQPVPMRLWRVIANICSGHGKDISDTMNRPHKEIGLDNDEVHPRMIQLLLRLADTLDLDNNRFNHYQLAQWGIEEMPLESIAHVSKHKSLEHLHVDPRSISVIARMDYADWQRNKTELSIKEEKLFYKFWEKSKQYEFREMKANHIKFELLNKEHELVGLMRELDELRLNKHKMTRVKREASRLVKKYMAETKKELEYLAVNWQCIVPEYFHGSAPMFDEGNSAIWWRKKKLDDEIADLKYSISHRRASEIMRGASLYGDADNMANPLYFKYYHHLLFLREFVQNGMDAMKLQLFRNIQNNVYGIYDVLKRTEKHKWDIFDILKITSELEKYAVIIKVHYKLSDSALVFKIIDNGCGIDKDTMKMMKEVGAKKPHREQEEVESMPEWMRPNGAFGIGMQSVYAVTDYFCGISKPGNDLEYEMLFEYGEDGGNLFAEEIIKNDDADDARCREYGAGTMFQIEITRETIIKHGMFKGVTQFDYDIDSVFCDISEKIDTFIGEDLFPVKIKFFIDEIEVYKEPAKTYESAFKNILDKYKKYEMFIYETDKCKNTKRLPNENNHTDKNTLIKDTYGFTYFSKPCEKDECVITSFNTEYNILIEINFRNKAYTEYYYRGLNVPEIYNNGLMQYNGCALKIRHWGGNADEILVVSRNKMTSEAKEIVNKEIFEAVDVALGHYFHYLCKLNDGDYAQQIELVDLYALVKAIFFYIIRTASSIKKPTVQIDECEKLLKKIIDSGVNASEKAIGLRAVGEESLSYETVESMEVYSKPFNKIWFVQGDRSQGYRDRQTIMPADYQSNVQIDPGEIIVYDSFMESMYGRHTSINVKRLFIMQIGDLSPRWVYQLGNSMAGIILSDSTLESINEKSDNNKNPLATGIKYKYLTEKLFTYQALDYGVQKKYANGYPLAEVLIGRLVIPGFESYKGLTVHSFPYIKNLKYESNIFYNLGSYFLWPFSFEQIMQIKIWAMDMGKEKFYDFKGYEVEKLKEISKIFSDGLSEDNIDFNNLIKYVVHNLTPDSINFKSGNIGDYQQAKLLEDEIRKRYIEIINKVVWPILHAWICDVVRF